MVTSAGKDERSLDQRCKGQIVPRRPGDVDPQSAIGYGIKTFIGGQVHDTKTDPGKTMVEYLDHPRQEVERGGWHRSQRDLRAMSPAQLGNRQDRFLKLIDQTANQRGQFAPDLSGRDTPCRADGTIGKPEMIIDDLPDGGRHGRRTLAFAPDGALHINVGNPCDACLAVTKRRPTFGSTSRAGSARCSQKGFFDCIRRSTHSRDNLKSPEDEVPSRIPI